MCGIAGILCWNSVPCESHAVQALTDALAHRGPDGSGIHIDGPIGLGHRRLAILDLSDAGKQPMPFANRYWITFNGEIYNFIELRQELETLGVVFLTQTDTEVIMAAYRQWGENFVLRMNGMWAFAIWDSHRRELFLSRDRFGVKPLHYLVESSRFVFASELKAFLHLQGYTPRENRAEVLRQLSAIPSHEETMIAGVKLLRPGHNMLVCSSGTRIWRWWNTLDHLVQVPKRFQDQAEQFRELLTDACRLRMRSDVPIATCLSGGLDSSAILCLLSTMNKAGVGRLAGDYHRAFVATFKNTGHDEREYAESAIERASANARYCEMDSATLATELPAYTYDHEFIEQGSLLPVWAIYRELRRDGVVVSLDGLGADELLMGYGESLKGLLLASGNLFRSPLRTLDLARTLQRQFPDEAPLVRILFESDPFLRVAGNMLRSARRAVSRSSIKSQSPQPVWSEPLTTSSDLADADEERALQSLTPMNRELYRQYHQRVNQVLLRRYDRVSMAHGVEVRLPFLDWRLVAYCFSLPEESKAGGGYSKRILREAMRGILPEKVRTRTQKIGFQAPLREWMNGGLGNWAWQRVQSKHFLNNEVMDGKAIRDFMAPRHAAKNWTGRDARRVWRYVQADLLEERFFGH